MCHLPHEPRFPDTRLADDRHHLAVASAGAPESVAQLFQLRVSAHETRQPPRGGGRQPRPAGSGPDQLVDLDQCVEALHRHRPERRDLHVPLGKP
jgi:hypothetical protein